jgi:hypothetical protein
MIVLDDYRRLSTTSTTASAASESIHHLLSFIRSSLDLGIGSVSIGVTPSIALLQYLILFGTTSATIPKLNRLNEIPPK